MNILEEKYPRSIRYIKRKHTDVIKDLMSKSEFRE